MFYNDTHKKSNGFQISTSSKSIDLAVKQEFFEYFRFFRAIFVSF